MGDIGALAAYWRNEALHGDVAQALGDEITAEYARKALEAAEALDVMLKALVAIENTATDPVSATASLEACRVTAGVLLSKINHGGGHG